VEVEASDPEGRLAYVYVMLNNQPVSVDAEPPFEWTLDKMLLNHVNRIRAVAFDRDGNLSFATAYVLNVERSTWVRNTKRQDPPTEEELKRREERTQWEHKLGAAEQRFSEFKEEQRRILNSPKVGATAPQLDQTGKETEAEDAAPGDPEFPAEGAKAAEERLKKLLTDDEALRKALPPRRSSSTRSWNARLRKSRRPSKRLGAANSPCRGW